jgi:hypothetical protein
MGDSVASVAIQRRGTVSEDARHDHACMADSVASVAIQRSGTVSEDARHDHACKADSVASVAIHRGGTARLRRKLISGLVRRSPL